MQVHFAFFCDRLLPIVLLHAVLAGMILLSLVCQSACLSVPLSIAPKPHILQQKCLDKWIGSSPRKTITLQLTTHYTEHIPWNSHLLKHRRWCHVARKLEPCCEQVNRQNFHVWNSHRQRAARLFQTTPYDRLTLSNSWAADNQFS